MRNSLLKFYFTAAVILILTGCSVEHRKDIAVDRARDYIFEKIPRMSPQNATYIKYTYPKLIVSPIFITAKMSEKKQENYNFGSDYYGGIQFSKSKQFSQVALTWDLPDPKVSIMVIGTCYSDFQSWYPINLIIRPTDVAHGATLLPKNEENWSLEGDTFFKPIVGKSPSDEEFDKIQLPSSDTNRI